MKFYISTSDPVADDEYIYISGNHENLGNWQGDGIELNRNDDYNWNATILLPAGYETEYKFTRGSWDNEAISIDCIIPANHTAIAARKDIIRIKIDNWKDECNSKSAVITGMVQYHRSVKSQHLENNRDVIVWLPPDYNEESSNYPVLYMHDGQNIVDQSTSFLGADWMVDEVATELIEDNKMSKIIVVGVYNTNSRTAEYSPIHLGRAYTQFLIEELKPFIDKNYRTLTGPENTAIAGSSMGGIISFHIAWEHPDVFGMSACMSPAFMIDDNEIVKRVKSYSGIKKPVKFYIDNGTIGLEKQFDASMNEIIRLLKNMGYEENVDLMVYIDEGAEHNEIAWSKRVHMPLLYFFGLDLINPFPGYSD
ncbi:MAG: histidine kinase [Candidatus Marinimicrobia bacterium]|nr:histidine kinase [Candidatus Neomarinimicrobiota bacterium]MBT3682731.1 histidine kinase [Candidatus Neomarinimicrobiota bacterium]MBT3759614.1 histidine kinase [Candidatus Neomarinimicrobiota bacterium]MBT3894514.1 histidine kinase [Candidatus Neomarinimicrobiota bacterium]MBT4172557.1 histidine kinase [Candidatus Neomarinimicrobiota bacterium]